MRLSQVFLNKFNLVLAFSQHLTAHMDLPNPSHQVLGPHYLPKDGLPVAICDSFYCPYVVALARTSSSPSLGYKEKFDERLAQRRMQQVA